MTRRDFLARSAACAALALVPAALLETPNQRKVRRLRACLSESMRPAGRAAIHAEIRRLCVA